MKFSKLAYIPVALAVLFSLASCNKKQSNPLAGTWKNSTGTSITFDPAKATAVFSNENGKNSYSYRARREHKFMVNINVLLQFGMDMGNDYAGQELQFGTLYLNSDGTLDYKMSDGSFKLKGGTGTTVEDIDGVWESIEATGPFARFVLDLSRESGEFSMTGYFDDDVMMGDDAAVLQMAGSYRTVPFMSMIFYNTEQEAVEADGIEYELRTDELLLLDGERFFRQ